MYTWSWNYPGQSAWCDFHFFIAFFSDHTFVKKCIVWEISQVIKYMTIKLINISHEVQGSWFHTGSYSQLRWEWFKVVNFLLSSDNYAHTLSYLATVMRKVYAVRNSTYIRYAIQILVVCALRKRKNASATETMPRHNSPNKDQFIFT